MKNNKSHHTEFLKSNEFSKCFTIPEKILFDTNISSTSKCLYAVIREHSDKKFICDMSNTKLANALNVSIPTITRGLKELKKQGYINTKIVMNADETLNRIIFL